MKKFLKMVSNWIFSGKTYCFWSILGPKCDKKLFGLAFIDIFNYSLFLYTIKRLSATFTTLVDYVVPIVGILVGYIFLDEIVDNIFFVTLILIFISLYLAVKDESENLN